MDKELALQYVKASAAALSLPLDDARAERVAVHLVLSAALAQQLDAYPLEPHDELVAIYTPAPFPSALGGRRTP